jgi:hypothetical protein
MSESGVSVSRRESTVSLHRVAEAVHCHILTFLDHVSHVRYARAGRRQKFTSERHEASPQVVVVMPGVWAGTSRDWRARDANCDVYGRRYRRDYTRVNIDSREVIGAPEASISLDLPSYHAAPGLSSSLASLPSCSLTQFLPSSASHSSSSIFPSPSPTQNVRSNLQDAATLPPHASRFVASFWRLRPRVLDLGGACVNQSDLELICDTMRSLQLLCMNVRQLINLEPLQKLPLLHTLCMYYCDADISTNKADDRSDDDDDDDGELAGFLFVDKFAGPKGLESIGAQITTLVFPLLMLPFVTQYAPPTVTCITTFLRERVRQNWGGGRDYSRFPQLETLRFTADEPFDLAMLGDLALACPRLATLKCALQIADDFMAEDTLCPYFPSLTSADFSDGGYSERAPSLIEAPRLVTLMISDATAVIPSDVPFERRYPARVPFARRYPMLASFALHYTLDLADETRYLDLADETRYVDQRAYAALDAVIASAPQIQSLELVRTNFRGQQRHRAAGIGNVRWFGVNRASDSRFMWDTSLLTRLVLRGLAGDVWLPVLVNLTYLDVRGCAWVAQDAPRCVPQLEILCADLSPTDMCRPVKEASASHHPFQPLLRLQHLHTFYILVSPAAVTETAAEPAISSDSKCPNDVQLTRLKEFITHVTETLPPLSDDSSVSRVCVDKLVCWCYSDAPDVIRFTTRFACGCDICVPVPNHTSSFWTLTSTVLLPTTTTIISRCRFFSRLWICAMMVLFAILWAATS